jgi:hypothetical protein
LPPALEGPYDSYMKVRSEALSRGYSFTDEVFPLR